MFIRIISVFVLLSIVVTIPAQNPENYPNPNGLENRTGKTILDITGKIKGIVLESTTSKPVEYANVVLHNSKDSSMVSGAVTDEKGLFELEKVPYGNYYLTFSFIGYDKKKIENVILKPGSSLYDAGNVSLEPSSSILGEVKITSERKTVEYKLDKKVVNVDKNIASAGGSAIDVLQNVPSVSVDENGGLLLRGNSDVTILIDGRPSSITGTKLEQIPATAIQSVEVITNPSVKYNPEGMSGIINIVLKKRRASGLNGMASTTYGTGGKYSGSLNLNYNTGVVNFFGSLDGRENNAKGYGKSTSISWSPVYDVFNNFIRNDSIYIVQDGKSKVERNSLNFKLGMDWALNQKNTLTLAVYRNNGSDKDIDNTKSSTYQGFKGTLLKYDDGSGIEKETELSTDYTLNYRKTFAKKGQELTLDAVYTKSEDNEGSENHTNYFSSDNTIFSDPWEQKANTFSKQNNANIQLNYIHPFRENFQYEGGFQNIVRNTADDYLLQTVNAGSWVDDASKSNNFAYNEQIYSVYSIVSGTIKKFSFQTGLRVEQVLMNFDQKTQDNTFRRDYLSFFPSIHLTQKLTQTQSIQLSYSRRINRPRTEMLNPFVEYWNDKMMRQGNPYLKPEYVDSYELGYARFWDKANLNGDVFFRQTNDAFSRVTKLVDFEKGLYLNTTENASFRKSYGVEMMVDYEFFKWWRVSMNYSFFGTEIRDTLGRKNNNTTQTAKLMSNFSFGKGFTMQFNLNYRGPMVMVQSQMNPMLLSDFALRKDILKDKLTFTFRFSDLFNTQKWSGKSWGDNFSATNERRRDSQVLFVGLQYKFGQDNGKKQQKKRQQQGEDNNFDSEF